MFIDICLQNLLMLHHPVCAASLCHMADDDVDADVIAASQHPWLSLAAISPLLFVLIDGAEASSCLSSLLLP